MLGTIQSTIKKGKRAFLKSHVRLVLFKIRNFNKEKFLCPICRYNGPYADFFKDNINRKKSACPKCGSLERYRLQFLVIKKISEQYDFSSMSVLHFSPEPFLREHIKNMFGSYYSADLCMKNVDLKKYLLKLPFMDNTFDFVFAPDILDYVKNDINALSEIKRILKPDGIAVIPVSIISKETIEYPDPDESEGGRVRAAGPEYYRRYSDFFGKVVEFDSSSFPDINQLYIYEDRSKRLSNNNLRPVMEGEKHIDIVPVCYM